MRHKITQKIDKTPLIPCLSFSQLVGLDNSHIHWLSNKIGIHKDMVNAYKLMQSSALKAGISLKIASGYRGLDRQLSIWNQKFLAQTPVKTQTGEIIDVSQLSSLEKVHAIMLYSALPGASRHHWGTDIDVYATNLLTDGQPLQLEPWEYSSSGPFAVLVDWLDNHAKHFGFYFPYDRFRGGIAAEPWHLSYAPLAETYQQQLTVDVLKQIITSIDLEGKNVIIKNITQLFEQFIINTTPYPYDSLPTGVTNYE